MRFALLLSFALAACKGDPQKCEQAARNYATLTFWKKADAEIAKLPAAEQELARKKKLSEFTNALERDIDFFVGQCQSANNDDQVDCMIAAKTAEQVQACADPAATK
ncbi:MAG: hypothetical protein ACTHU0_08805 [Kofleriaceae bacterium]